MIEPTPPQFAAGPLRCVGVMTNDEKKSELAKEADALRKMVTEALVAKGVQVTSSQHGSILLRRGNASCSVAIFAGGGYHSCYKYGVAAVFDAVSTSASRWRCGLRAKRITRDTAAEHNVENIVADLTAVLDLKDRQAAKRRENDEAEKQHAKETARLEALANQELPDPKKIFIRRVRLADGRYNISFQREMSLATANAIQNLLSCEQTH